MMNLKKSYIWLKHNLLAISLQDKAFVTTSSVTFIKYFNEYNTLLFLGETCLQLAASGSNFTILNHLVMNCGANVNEHVSIMHYVHSITIKNTNILLFF